jgi:hypothetical protein
MDRTLYVTNSYPPLLPTDLIPLVFDRMFSLGVRGSGVEAAPLTARAVGAAAPAGLKRHFLYCSLKPEVFNKPVSQTKGLGPGLGTTGNGGSSGSLGVTTGPTGNRLTRDSRMRSIS